MDAARTVVLLLEDEPFIALEVEEALEAFGLEVFSAGTCSGAREWLRIHTPVVAVVDPELSDGRCDDIVRLLIDRDIPIIVHSGVGKAELSETDFAAGKFFGKPSQTELLADTVFQLSGST